MVCAWNVFDMPQMEQKLLFVIDPSKPCTGMRRVTTIRSTTDRTNDDGLIMLYYIVIIYIYINYINIYYNIIL